jgi:hypothetical protein
MGDLTNKIMEKVSHISMHKDHAIWQSDISMWSHDLKMWEQEMESLEQVISLFEEALKQHKLTLLEHVRVLAEHRTRLDRHEIDLGLITEGSKIDQDLGKEHEAEAERHISQRRAHERLKRYHHSLITISKNLQKALESPV